MERSAVPGPGAVIRIGVVAVMLLLAASGSRAATRSLFRDGGQAWSGDRLLCPCARQPDRFDPQLEVSQGPGGVRFNRGR
jgi:hypothetical protein